MSVVVLIINGVVAKTFLLLCLWVGMGLHFGYFFLVTCVGVWVIFGFQSTKSWYVV